MDFGAAVVADEQPAALMEPGEGALDDPAVAAEAGAVAVLAAREYRFDPARPQLPPVSLRVVGAVSEQPLGAAAGPANATADRRDAVEQRQQLRDVVAVATGESPGQRQAAAVGQEVVFGARTAPVDRARARFGALFFAWI